jgi:head-tail adaptor
MGISKYFETVELWREQDVVDDFGQTVKAWVKLKDIQGRIRQLGASEKYSSDIDNTISTHRLYTFELGITNTDQVKFDTKFYRVIRSNNVMNMGRFAQVDLELIE